MAVSLHLLLWRVCVQRVKAEAGGLTPLRTASPKIRPAARENHMDCVDQSQWPRQYAWVATKCPSPAVSNIGMVFEQMSEAKKREVPCEWPFPGLCRRESASRLAPICAHLRPFAALCWLCPNSRKRPFDREIRTILGRIVGAAFAPDPDALMNASSLSSLWGIAASEAKWFSVGL
jgi:hypothetical protein